MKCPGRTPLLLDLGQDKDGRLAQIRRQLGRNQSLWKQPLEGSESTLKEGGRRRAKGGQGQLHQWLPQWLPREEAQWRPLPLVPGALGMEERRRVDLSGAGAQRAANTGSAYPGLAWG